MGTCSVDALWAGAVTTCDSWGTGPATARVREHWPGDVRECARPAGRGCEPSVSTHRVTRGGSFPW
eukprot:967542-Alexandrium_andersonii.AAC.1